MAWGNYILRGPGGPVSRTVKIAVIDGQGGGIGKVIVERIRRELPEDTEIIALGTNALATSIMLKAGANEGASGEPAVVFNAPRVDIIVGAIGVILPGAMLGELTLRMAESVAMSPAKKLLLPLGRNNLKIIGTLEEPLPHMVDNMINEIKKALEVA